MRESIGISSYRRGLFFLAMLLVVAVCVIDGSAQTTRKKRSRRATNPVTSVTGATPAPAAQTTEPKIISTADEMSADLTNLTTNASRRTGSQRGSTQNTEPGSDKVDRLSAQVTALQEKLTLMEEQQRTLVDLDRLSRAEQRGETLRAQLREVQEKESTLLARAEEIDYELQPAIIERSMAVNGSTKPEELRELRRRFLESEKSRVQAQIAQLATSRARLETAIASADSEADRIRTRIETVTNPDRTATNDPSAPDQQRDTTSSPTTTPEGQP